MIIGILLALSVLLNVALTLIAWRFAKIVMTIEDKLNDATETIGIADTVISEILKRPLFYDSPEVREVLNSIKRVQTAIADIAYGLDITEADVDEIIADKTHETIN